jgi:hypothetical protein
MLIPKVKAKEFEKFGFKKCKGEYGKNSIVVDIMCAMFENLNINQGCTV